MAIWKLDTFAKLVPRVFIKSNCITLTFFPDIDCSGINGCKYCDSVTECNTCTDGYYLDGTICKSEYILSKIRKITF